jgi:hypothetical protein
MYSLNVIADLLHFISLDAIGVKKRPHDLAAVVAAVSRVVRSDPADTVIPV